MNVHHLRNADVFAHLIPDFLNEAGNIAEQYEAKGWKVLPGWQLNPANGNLINPETDEWYSPVATIQIGDEMAYIYTQWVCVTYADGSIEVLGAPKAA